MGRTHAHHALTGPAAAKAYGLDGFRDHVWEPSWCTTTSRAGRHRVVRARDRFDPTLLGDVVVCPIPLVLRHVGASPADLVGLADGITARDRLELAVEHALRDGHAVTGAGGGNRPGDVLLREVLRLRGDEPSTESYAETRAVQRFRTFDITPWRQIQVFDGHRLVHRADFMIPYRQLRTRPQPFMPGHGLLVEIDSVEWHADNFERDQRRGTLYTALGYDWLSFTPNQIEHESSLVRRAVNSALRRRAT